MPITGYEYSCPELVLVRFRTSIVLCSEPVLFARSRTGIVLDQNRQCTLVRTSIDRAGPEPVLGSAQNRYRALVLGTKQEMHRTGIGSVPEPVLGVHRTGIGPLPVSGMPLLLKTGFELPRTGIVQLPLWGVTCLVLNTGFGAQNRFCAVLCSKPVLSSPEPVLDHYRYWE